MILTRDPRRATELARAKLWTSLSKPNQPGVSNSLTGSADGPSAWDTQPWTSNTAHPQYPSYVLEPGQLWRISNDGSGIPSPIPSYPVNKCVGNQK